MDNVTRYYNEDSYGNYTQIGAIGPLVNNPWNNRSVILPTGDVYWPGERNGVNYYFDYGGKVKLTWWWYLDEGYGGSSSSIVHNYEFTF